VGPWEHLKYCGGVKMDKFSCENRDEQGWCTNSIITDNPYPTPIFCIFQTQESQQRLCKGYAGDMLVWDYIKAKLVKK